VNSEPPEVSRDNAAGVTRVSQARGAGEGVGVRDGVALALANGPADVPVGDVEVGPPHAQAVSPRSTTAVIAVPNPDRRMVIPSL
jgi:hypothetical protein